MLREQDLQIEYDKTTLLTKLPLHSRLRQAVTGNGVSNLFIFIFLTCRICGINIFQIANDMANTSSTIGIVIIKCYYLLLIINNTGQSLPDHFKQNAMKYLKAGI